MSIKKQIEEIYLYFDEDNRRKTFKKWVFSDKVPCSANKMAEAGFIYIGNKYEPDAVKCFFCGKPLDGWEYTDNPWNEHIKHAPNCSFAKLQTSQNDLTFTKSLDLQTELKMLIIKAIMDQCEEFVEEKITKLKTLISKR